METGVMLVVDGSSGLCINAVVLGGGSWAPPEGCIVVPPADGAWIGWTLSENGWTPPPEGG